MEYINQLDYQDLPYPTTMEQNAPLEPPYPSVARAGCGLCCACMMVAQLTPRTLSVPQCIELAVNSGANRFGTNINRLGTALAKRFGLEMQTTDSIPALVHCLRQGGCAIANVGGNREKYQGVLSDGGHFVLVSNIEQGTVWILDPARTAEKYQKAHRRNAVRLEGDYVITGLTVLQADTENRSPAFYLFSHDCSTKIQVPDPVAHIG